ncbi:MAG: helix-turn-helix domain-containing protein [Flavobacteriaceae bacterium]|nr:helix-turn-helix domain-containing protein [Flavobacteriaceae bacterium]
MKTREELLRSKEYWLEKIQNTLFNELEDYIENKGINKTAFAKELGVSKSYLSQILNGNFDHKLSKLIELSLAINKIPMINFIEVNKCLTLDKLDRLALIETYDININIKFNYSYKKIIEKSPKKSSFDKIIQEYGILKTKNVSTKSLYLA